MHAAALFGSRKVRFFSLRLLQVSRQSFHSHGNLLEKFVRNKVRFAWRPVRLFGRGEELCNRQMGSFLSRYKSAKVGDLLVWLGTNILGRVASI